MAAGIIERLIAHGLADPARRAEGWESFFSRLDRWQAELLAQPDNVTFIVPGIEDGTVVAKPARKRGPRKPTLASVARQAREAGIAVARYEFEPGKIVVIPGKTGDQTINEWDEVLTDGATETAVH